MTTASYYGYDQLLNNFHLRDMMASLKTTIFYWVWTGFIVNLYFYCVCQHIHFQIERERERVSRTNFFFKLKSLSNFGDSDNKSWYFYVKNTTEQKMGSV